MEKIALGVNSNIKTMIISGLFDAANGITNFYSPVYVEFVPDMITVKNFNAHMNNDTDLTSFKIKTDLVDSAGSSIVSWPFTKIVV